MPTPLHATAGYAGDVVRPLLEIALADAREGRPFSLAGLQGTGKSTLSAQIADAAAARGLRAVVLSIDDFYLDRPARLRLGREVHPLLATRGPRMGWNDAAFGALVAAFPNTGFMGVPLLVALLGAAAAGPAILTIAIDMVITSSLCVALSRLDVAGTHGMAVALRKALRGMAGNPMPWAIALGALASALHFTLPGPLDQSVAMLADAASPVALFTIGAVLARSQMNEHERVQARDYVPIALAKLLLHPLLVWGVGQGAIALGLPLSPFALTALVLLAALPSASNVALLAERFGAHNGRIARTILVSTALAFVSFSGAVALLT